MAFRLPRLPKDISLVNVAGRVSVEFQRWWQSAMTAIENVLIDLTETIARVATTEADIAALEAVTFTAGNGLTGGGNILTNPAFAVGAGTGIVVNANDVAVSATLAAYDGGDMPSAFTLSIVDSADAGAWRTAIGAGTSSTTGTVTSVAASVPTGFSIAGSPITTSGTLAITYAAGYQGYTTAEATRVAGAALTKTDDTNVTLTLGGTPATALLAATSLTLGWTGQLSVARGGTGVATLTSGALLKGNGTSAVSASVINDDGTDTAVGTAVVSGVRMMVRGTGTSSAAYALFARNSANADMFLVRNDGLIGTGLAATSPYNNTTASAANMVVDSNGNLFRSTSSARYKTDIEDYTRGLDDLKKLRPVFYKGNKDGDRVFAGLIAEEVDEAGLSEFVLYDDQGRPDALHYANMVALLVKAVQELTAKVDG